MTARGDRLRSAHRPSSRPFPSGCEWHLHQSAIRVTTVRSKSESIRPEPRGRTATECDLVIFRSALRREEGWRRSRRRIPGRHSAHYEKLKSKGRSNRAIAHQLGVDEPAPMKLDRDAEDRALNRQLASWVARWSRASLSRRTWRELLAGRCALFGGSKSATRTAGCRATGRQSCR